MSQKNNSQKNNFFTHHFQWLDLTWRVALSFMLFDASVRQSVAQNPPAFLDRAELPSSLSQSAQTPYVVIIPVQQIPTNRLQLRQELQRIRSMAPGAFFTRHRLGNCIYVQGFETSSAAHVLSAELDRQGWDARVIYIR